MSAVRQLSILENVTLSSGRVAFGLASLLNPSGHDEIIGGAATACM